MSESCVLCTYDTHRDPLDQILKRAGEYYAKPARFGAFGPGHILCMPVDHVTCFGAQTAERDEEAQAFVSDLEARVRAGFRSGVIISENGVYGQSVKHAHLHLFPMRADHYEIRSLVEMVPAGIRVSEAPDFAAIRKAYNNEGEYVTVWEPSGRFLIHTQGVAPNTVRLRDLFLAATGLTHLRNWADLNEKERQQNDAWVKSTVFALIT